MQLDAKWAVLLVNSAGEIQSQLAFDKSYSDAIAIAADWQSRLHSEAAVVVRAPCKSLPQPW